MLPLFFTSKMLHWGGKIKLSFWYYLLFIPRTQVFFTLKMYFFQYVCSYSLKALFYCFSAPTNNPIKICIFNNVGSYNIKKGYGIQYSTRKGRNLSTEKETFIIFLYIFSPIWSYEIERIRLLTWNIIPYKLFATRCLHPLLLSKGECCSLSV